MTHIEAGRVHPNWLVCALRRRWRVPSAAVLLALALLALPAAGAGARPAAAVKLVRYHGVGLTIPAAWPVYDLARRPSTCVRFDHHAVYLGVPGPQSCPAHAAGRTEAILVMPRATTAARSGGGRSAPLTLPAAGAAEAPGGSGAEFVSHGLVVVATWNHQPTVIRRALGIRSLKGLDHERSAVRAADARATPSASTARAASPGAVFTGQGFDACAAPSTSQMSAWSASPYRGIGVYIGGANMACSQDNLTSDWVNQEAAAGWHLIPIYVGLQAPVELMRLRGHDGHKRRRSRQRGRG